MRRQSKRQVDIIVGMFELLGRLRRFSGSRSQKYLPKLPDLPVCRSGADMGGFNKPMASGWRPAVDELSLVLIFGEETPFSGF